MIQKTMEHTLSKAKLQGEKYMLASSPIEFATSCTMTGQDLKRIASKPTGDVILFRDMIDDCDLVEQDLKRHVSSLYSLRDAKELSYNFLLTDLTIGDIQTMDNNGGLVVGGSLAFPAIDCISHPTDITDGRYRRIFDIDKSHYYTLGQKHSFLHPLKHGCVSREYQLIGSKSRTLEPVLYPNSQIGAASGSSIFYKVRQDQSLEAVPSGPVLIHGHMIDNETAYDSQDRPICSLYSTAVPNQPVTNTYHALLPQGSYQHVWFHKREELKNGANSLVPIDEYTQATYDFLHQVNSNRCTNFDHSGISWNAQLTRDVPCMKFTLKFRVVPIIERQHQDSNPEAIPFATLRNHLQSLMVQQSHINMKD